MSEEPLSKSWIWDELKRCGAADSNEKWFTNLQGEIHPLFLKQRWNGVSTERHNALHQSFILGTKLLQVGAQYLCNFLPAERMKKQMTTFMSPTRNHRLPIHLGWTSEDVKEAFDELDSIAEYVQWEENKDMWPKHQWIGMNRPSVPPTAVETRSSSPLSFNAEFGGPTDEAWARARIRAKAADRRHCDLTILVASQFVDAVLQSETNSEEHMVALFAAAINLIHELGNTIFLHRTDWDQKPLWVGKDIVADPGDSMLAWLFDGWFPEVNFVSNEKAGYEFNTGMHWHKMFRVPVEQPKALFFYSIPLKHIQRIMSRKEWGKFSSLSQDFARIRYDLLSPATPFRAGEYARRGYLLSEDAWSDKEVFRDFSHKKDSNTRDNYFDEDWNDQPASSSRKRQRSADDHVQDAGSSGRDTKRQEHSPHSPYNPTKADIEDAPSWFKKGIFLPNQNDTVQEFIDEQNRMFGENSPVRQYMAEIVASFNRQLLPDASPHEDKDYYEMHDQSETPVRRAHFLEYKKKNAETMKVMNKCIWDAFVDCRKVAAEAAQWRQRFEEHEATKTTEIKLDLERAEVAAAGWKKKCEEAELRVQEHKFHTYNEKEHVRQWREKHRELKLAMEKNEKNFVNQKVMYERIKAQHERLELQNAQAGIVAEQTLKDTKAKNKQKIAEWKEKCQALESECSLTTSRLRAAVNARVELQEGYDELSAALEVFAKQPSDGAGDVAYWQQQFADGFLKWANSQAEFDKKARGTEENMKAVLARLEQDLQEGAWQEDVNRPYPLQESGDIETNLMRRLAKIQAKKALLKELDEKLKGRR